MRGETDDDDPLFWTNGIVLSGERYTKPYIIAYARIDAVHGWCHK